jgi:hypothetical protein
MTQINLVNKEINIMARKVRIPDYMNPYTCEINRVKYEYIDQGGQEIEVPDEVADLIEANEAMKPVALFNAHLPDGIVVRSSTPGSTKALKITVNDGGVITAKVVDE